MNKKANLLRRIEPIGRIERSNHGNNKTIEKRSHNQKMHLSIEFILLLT